MPDRIPLLMQPSAAAELRNRVDAAIRAGQTRAVEHPPRVLNLPGRLAAESDPEWLTGGPFCGHRAGPLGIVQVDGPMWYSPSVWAGLGGGGSVSAIVHALDRFAADDRVLSIVMDVASPGGESTCMGELADAVARARSVKPVHGRGHDAYSLGYAALCGCTSISMAAGARIGSIGSIIWMIDDSEALAADGLRVLAASSAKRKLCYAPGQPLGAEVQAELQAVADRCGEDFCRLVSKTRGIPVETVRSWEGAVFFGDEAKALGLVDRLETEHAFYERVLAEAEGARSSTSAGSRSRPVSAAGSARKPKGGRMPGTQNKGGAPKAATAKDLLARIKSEVDLDEEDIEKIEALVDEEDTPDSEDKEEKPESKAGNAARPGTPASFAELDRVVPRSLSGRDALIAQMQREGACVNMAMGMVQDALLKEIGSLKGETANSAAAKAETAGFTRGRAPVPGANRVGKGEETAGQEWERRVNERVQATSCARHEAARWLADSDPELRRRYIAERNQNRNRD